MEVACNSCGRISSGEIGLFGPVGSCTCGGSLRVLEVPEPEKNLPHERNLPHRLTDAQLMEFSLAEARRFYFQNLREGAVCPGCDRHGKIYKRKFNSKMALALVHAWRLDRDTPGRWIHLAQEIPYEKRGSDYGMLPYWGFMEEKESSRDDGNPRAGFYRMTQGGRDFVLGRRRARKHIYLYNDAIHEVDESDPETTTIREALGDHFDYDELVRA